MKRLSMLRRMCASSVTRTTSDATQRLTRLNCLMMRLKRAVARVRVGRVLHPGARHQLARSHEHKVGARRQRHLPRDLDRVVVEQRAALRIELVAAVLEHFLGRRFVRRPLAVKRQRRLARATRGTRPRASRQTSARCHKQLRESANSSLSARKSLA
jgi:hypothetical protein